MLRKSGKIIVFILLLVLMFPSNLGSYASSGGSVFLGGGSIDDYNYDLWSSLKDATGVENPKVAVFCSGAGSLALAEDAYYNDIPDHLSWKNLFELHGFVPTLIPIAIDNYESMIDDQAYIDIVNSSDMVWFNGGDQSRHARSLLKDDGTDTPLMAAVRSVYTNGGIIAGSSAGAAIQGELSYGEGISYGYLKANGLAYKEIADLSLEDPNDYDNGGYMYGFNFLSDINACVDTHVDSRGRIGRMAVALRDLNADVAIGVYENSGILIKNGLGSVVGERGVLILDGFSASFGTGSYFEASNLGAYSLSSGDTIDLNSMTVNSSKAMITAPYYSRMSDSRSIFSGDEFVKLMEKLVDCDESTAYGKSSDRNPQFYLDFTKDSYTKGYYSSGMYTVENLRLDITY